MSGHFPGKFQRKPSETMKVRTRGPELKFDHQMIPADAQDLADVLLDVEMRLGEILEEIPRSYPLGSPGQTKTLPPGIDKRTSHIAQTLAQHLTKGYLPPEEESLFFPTYESRYAIHIPSIPPAVLPKSVITRPSSPNKEGA